MLERLLSRKVELWVLVAVILAGFVGALLFAMVAYDLARGNNRIGPLGGPVEQVLTTPSVLSRLVKDLRDPTRDLLARGADFEGQAGFDFAYAPGTRPGAPYLLLNRYDGDRRRSVSALVDLDAQQVVTEWVYDVEPFWHDSGFQSGLFDLARDFGNLRFRGTHAILEPAGDLVVHAPGAPLLKIDLCGDLVWQEASHAYHHSLERDADGNYWAPIYIEPKNVDLGGPGFLEDGLAQVSPEGRVLQTIPLIEILDGNGLGYMIYGDGFATDDPTHLNDIEPVLEDGPIWQRGDLFLSLRNKSLLMLYRPATGKVLWWHAGDVIHQHDIDILDDSRILVFDNNAPLRGQSHLDADRSRVMVFDLATGGAAPIRMAAMDALDLRTDKQGLAEMMPDGTLFVEETERGRLAAIDPDGAIAWTYVNRAPEDGRVYTMNWSRIVPRSIGAAIRARLSEGVCNG